MVKGASLSRNGHVSHSNCLSVCLSESHTLVFWLRDDSIYSLSSTYSQSPVEVKSELSLSPVGVRLKSLVTSESSQSPV